MSHQPSNTDNSDMDVVDSLTEDEGSAPGAELPLGIIIARILVVTAMSFSAAVAIFAAIGAIWEIAAIAAILTIIFLFVMFGVERLAER